VHGRVLLEERAAELMGQAIYRIFTIMYLSNIEKVLPK
jgi:hypothetical protein